MTFSLFLSDCLIMAVGELHSWQPAWFYDYRATFCSTSGRRCVTCRLPGQFPGELQACDKAAPRYQSCDHPGL